MAVVLNPITLPAAKMISTMTALLSYVRFENNLEMTEIVDDFVDSCRVGKVEYGKGIVFAMRTGLQTVKDLSETSSAFAIAKPQIKEETITVDKYKTVELSYSDLLAPDAFTNGEQIAGFFEFVASLMYDSAKFSIYDDLLALVKGWAPGQATQTIQIDQIDTTGMTGETLLATERWNGTQIAKVMRKTMNNMKVPSTSFSDNEDTTTSVRGDRLKTIWNDTYYTSFMADTLASLYHEQKVGDMLPGGNFVLIPESKMTSADATTIAYLGDRNKWALVDFYTVVLSILDPSTTYRNMFYHFAYGTGILKNLAGVKFVAKKVTPPAAG